MLYLPVFHIDTNMINAYEKLPAMNQLEQWAKDEVILINMSSVSFEEAKQGSNLKRTQKTLSQIFTLVDEEVGSTDPVYREVSNALFPDGVSDENQRNDVKIVCEAIKWNAILITNDGDSKKQPGGILGNAHKLQHRLQIMRDTEAVEYIRGKIDERDARNRRISDTTGLDLPDWTGLDDI